MATTQAEAALQENNANCASKTQNSQVQSRPYLSLCDDISLVSQLVLPHVVRLFKCHMTKPRDLRIDANPQYWWIRAVIRERGKDQGTAKTRSGDPVSIAVRCYFKQKINISVLMRTVTLMTIHWQYLLHCIQIHINFLSRHEWNFLFLVSVTTKEQS